MDIYLGASAIAPIATIASRLASSRFLLEFVVLLIGIGGWAFGVVSWYATSVRKSYAAEQDFKAIARWMERCSQNQMEILKDQDRRFDAIDGELREMKAFNQACIAQRGDSPSGILRARNSEFPG